MTIEEKSVVAFIGPSGCGKSTLPRLFTPLNDIGAMRAKLATREFAAVIVEGIQGVAGIHCPTDEFLRAVRGHENAELVFIDEQNRDALLEKLLPHILRWNEA